MNFGRGNAQPLQWCRIQTQPRKAATSEKSELIQFTATLPVRKKDLAELETFIPKVADHHG